MGRGALIFLMTLAAYAPALRGGFIWDDDGHVTRPDLRSLHGLGRIWFDLGATQQYYPMLHSAFWVEHRLWGDAPLGYHLLNVLLHALAACLFAMVLRRLAVPGAWLAGAVFALHPVYVESVAWISEQKNTLSTVFYLLAVLGYFRWRDGVDRRRPGAGWSYAAASLFFLLALLSKSVTATLPAALLVVLWWREGTLTWRRDVAPLVPWFIIGTAGGLFTAWVERRYIGAQGAAFALGPVERGLLAGRVVWFYFGKLLWPSNLIFIYPHWAVNAASGWAYAFPAALLFALAALWRTRAWSRAPLAAGLLFVVGLFPALGFFNVYPFLFSYVADHFQYLAGLGIIALAAAAARAAITRSRGVAPRAAAAAVLAALGVLTWRQSEIYHDSATLYRATIAKNPDCWLAQFNLGDALLREGRLDEAMVHYQEAVRARPDYVEARNNLGGVLAHVGRLPEAIAQFEAALRDWPGDAKLHYNLGNALADARRFAEAQAEYQRALELRPDYPGARLHLALVQRLLSGVQEGRGPAPLPARPAP
jgi:tetratricopeptide (TPR) repeat protein